MTSSGINIAKGLLKQGNKKQAFGILKDILKNDPRNVEVWWLLANSIDDPAKKEKALQKLLTIQPDHRGARKALAQLMPQRSDSRSNGVSNRKEHESARKEKQQPSTHTEINPLYIAIFTLGIGSVVLLAVVVAFFSMNASQSGPTLNATYRYEPTYSLINPGTANTTEYFTANYPRDWHFGALDLIPNNLFVSNVPPSIETYDERIIEVNINLYNKTEHELRFTSNNPLEMLQNLDETESDVTIQEERFGERSASRIEVGRTQSSRFNAVHTLIIDEGDIMIHVITYVFEGTFSDHQDIVFGIADTMQYHTD